MHTHRTQPCRKTEATKTDLACESHTSNFRVSSITRSKSKSHTLQVGVSNPIDTSLSESELQRRLTTTTSEIRGALLLGGSVAS